jgi:hypothetical protein
MLKNLDQVVAMVLNSFQDPHPRVRWAAINAIGQLSTDLGPDLQVQYHGRVLPALAAAMDDFQNPRVQVSCSVGILCFFEQEFPLVSYSVMPLVARSNGLEWIEPPFTVLE